MTTMKWVLLASACAFASVTVARADDYVDMATKAAKAATARANFGKRIDHALFSVAY